MRVVALALALLVAAGAGTLWLRHDRRMRWAGLAAAVLGLALTPVAVAATRPDRLTAAASRSVHKGMSVDRVKAIAGRPAGSGEAVTRSGRVLDCLVYEAGAEDSPKLFCFDGDRLAAVQ